ncbi:MAG: DUF2130 domain-containing protein [Treponematales bacterium]
MEAVEKIKCPQCGVEIDVNAALRREIEDKMKADVAAQNAKYLSEIKKLKEENAETVAKLELEKEKEYSDRLTAEKEKIRGEVSKESEEALKTLRESLKEKSAQVIELHKAKAENERLKLEKDELQEKINREKEAELNRKLKEQRETHRAALEEERQRIKKEAEEENEQKIAELQKKLADQTALAAEMKRKAEQGSTQLQGEVRELAIEEILKDTFRFDEIEEVAKGVKGADVVQRVRDDAGNEAGIIVYESKRTKTFGRDWISKLKSDGALVKADVCVLVTEALPGDIERISQKDGVWVCTFAEFKGLALVLRDSLVRIHAAFSSQTNKGEKTQMLYDYLTGKEFAAQIRAVLEGFRDLQKGYVDERSRMERIWKEREKQLEKVLLNANSFIGSIRGIAGKAIPDIPALEDSRLLPES